MKRRSVLQSFLAAPLVAGAAAPAPAQERPKETLSVASTAAEAVADPAPHFFTAEQFATLQALAETIMPSAQGRPGAREAKTAEFLDFLISQSPADRQKLYRAGLDQLRAKGFPNGQKDAALQPLRAAWTYNGPKDPYARFLVAAKEDIIDATQSSREWSTSSPNRARAGSGYYWLPLE